MRKSRFYFVFLCLLSYSSYATVYNCSTTQEIHNAMANAQAGDEIVIASGTYTSSASINAAYFYGGADGTSSNPITIRSASSSNPAHLKGNSISSKTVLRIEGAYWIVKDLELSYGQKALVFDNANYGKAINCTAHTTGNEAIHIRDGSDHVVIDGCNVYNTGNVNPGFGEGIYVGTDKGSWSSYDPYCDYTVVKNCTIGPNVRAEAFDVKEGTQETVIEYNSVDATGISSSNYADSFVDLKGTRTYVRHNTFNQNGESNITKGIAAIDRSVELSSYEHAVHDNTFNMDGSSDNIVEAYSGTSDVHAWNNTRNPSGDMYNSRITQSCPSWYSQCGGGGNQTPSVSITSPSDGASYTEGDDITVTANASDSDGTISSVEFFDGSTSLGTDTSSPYSITITNAAAGSYAFTAQATDNDNAQSTSSVVSVTVGSSGGGGGSGNLSILYECGDTDATDNDIRPYVKIVNDGSSGVNYDELTVRYWFTKEGSGTPVFHCDYASLGTSYVNGAFVNTSGSNYYMEVSFDASAGTLSGNDDSGKIKLRMNKSDWSNFDETDDYSFDSSIGSYTSYSNITLYHNGTLVWGTEPGSGSRTASSETPRSNSDESTSALHFYPNPVSEKLQVRLGEEWNNSQVKVFNMAGTEMPVAVQQISTTELNLNLSEFQSGVYLLKLTNADSSISKRLIVD